MQMKPTILQADLFGGDPSAEYRDVREQKYTLKLEEASGQWCATLIPKGLITIGMGATPEAALASAKAGIARLAEQAAQLQIAGIAPPVK